MGTTISNQTPYRAVLPAVVTLGTVIDPFAPPAHQYRADMRVWQQSSAIWEPVITVFIFAPSPEGIARRVGLLAHPGLRHSELSLLKLALEPYTGSRISDSRIGGCFLGLEFPKLRYICCHLTLFVLLSYFLSRSVFATPKLSSNLNLY